MSLLVVLLGGVAGVFLLVKYLNIERIGNLSMDAAPEGEARNYLIVGSDARDDGGEVEGQRSDTVMVVRVSPGAERLAVLSIPRDLVVPISGTGETARINSAYAYGRDTLIATIRDNFGIALHHYVEIDFSSFEGLVDAAGGVPIWTDAAIRDQSSGLFVPELGCVELDGEQALAFVRARHLQHMTGDGTWSREDPTADLGRIQRQQVFMRRALATILGEARSNPGSLPRLVDRAVAAVAIDDGTSVTDLLDLADRFRDFDADRLQTYSLPVSTRADRATLAVDQESAAPILAFFRGEGPGDTGSGGSAGTGGSGDGTPTGSAAAGSPGTSRPAGGGARDAGDATREETSAPGAPVGEGGPTGRRDDPPAAVPAEPPAVGSPEFLVGDPPQGESC